MKKKILFSFVLLWIGIFSYAQVTVNRITSSTINGNPQYVFSPSTDIIYRDANGTTNFGSVGTGGICSGATHRSQLNSVILKLNSSATNNIVVHGTSSGTARSLSSIETSTTLAGPYTVLTGVTSSSTINSSSVCGTLIISNISIPNNTFIRFTFSGNVNLSGFDVTQFNPIVEPTTQATNISFENVSSNSLSINWTNGNGSNRVVFVKEGTQGTIEDPTDGDEFTANNNWNNGAPTGTQLGTSGYFCVYNGSASTVNLSNLDPFTTYWVRVYEYNGSGTSTDYFLSTATNNPNSQATLASPITASFSGILNIGETLEGSYEYSEFPGDVEGDSEYQWYVADDSFGLNQSAILGATSLSYLIQLADEGKYLRFGVVPTDINEVQGSESFSDWQLVNSRPIASSVIVSGILNVSEEVSATYSFNDVDNDLEGLSSYQWYRADDELGTNSEAILDANATAYTLDAADLAKYIRFGVIPAASSGSTPGDEIFGNWTGPILSQDAPSVIATGVLTENSLNTDVISLTLVNDTFNSNTLNVADFALNNAPSGLTLNQITWINSTEAEVSFSYNDEDFDVDVTNFSITINASTLDSNTTLTTLDMAINALIETLEVSGDLLFEDVCVNQESQIESFEVSGSNLKSGNITIAAVDGFEYAETVNGVYSTTLDFMHAGGDLISKTIFVKFVPSTVANYSDSIEVSSPGAPSAFQAVTASGITLPSSISSPTSSMIGSNQAVAGGDITAVGCSEVIERGIYYSTTNGFANGEGTKVSETSDSFETGAFSVSTTGLSTGTTYYYKAFARDADDVSVYTSQGTFTTLAIAEPNAIDATDNTCNSFTANWEAVEGASSYQLDVSTFPNFGSISVNPNQTLLSNTGVLGLPGWSETNVTVSSGALSMVSNTSQIITAAFNISSYTGVQLNFSIRTFGGVTGNSNQVVISISTDNGANWSSLGTTTAAGSSLNPAAPYSLDAYLGSQVRLKFETPNAISSRGIGLDNITVTGDQNTFTPSFVENYEDVTINGLSLGITGLDTETDYYYRVRSSDATSVSNNSNTIAATTLPLTIWYADADGDGFGNDEDTEQACTQPDGYVAVGGDCNDNANTIYPGATEICYDGILQNCNGDLNDGCPVVLTQIRPYFCGTTLQFVNSSILADTPTGLPVGATITGYRYEITNLSTTAVREVEKTIAMIRINETDMAGFNTAYSIRVMVRINNEWQDYGTACTILTPAIPTTAVSTVCGQVLPSLQSAIYATTVVSSTGYEFEVSRMEGGVAVETTTIERSVNNFKLTLLSGIQYVYASEYQVRVRVKANVNGVEVWSNYGAVCSVYTPEAPEAAIDGCGGEEGIAPAALNTPIYATPLTGATQYRFTLSDGVSYNQVYTTSGRFFRLSNFNALQTLTPGGNYSVTVEAEIYGYFYPGKDCNILVPGGGLRSNLVKTEETINLPTDFKAVAYPNPFVNSFAVDVRTSNTEKVSLTVYNMAGRLLEVKEVNASEVANYQFGDRYPSGVYNMIVTQGEETRTVRVVKQ
ncbi:T9SS type A sorting domain-containing protein [Flavobacterium azooxidireducens]|uniref:T9SS type A sorting domain-containing protein n=1 Tax=Flavobacterium azooxidireducens TaxID=1871076 RepID=A0ABY4KDV0_9FLAO|nr:T9SS type A sorting domain-containing protein [Flavobacterium azooxidireducens]UPQ78889.1 T9SS type A sorting domain-containing protein [Flavobacterium azooxidireducens]